MENKNFFLIFLVLCLPNVSAQAIHISKNPYSANQSIEQYLKNINYCDETSICDYGSQYNITTNESYINTTIDNRNFDNDPTNELQDLTPYLTTKNETYLNYTVDNRVNLESYYLSDGSKNLNGEINFSGYGRYTAHSESNQVYHHFNSSNPYGNWKWYVYSDTATNTTALRFHVNPVSGNIYTILMRDNRMSGQPDGFALWSSTSGFASREFSLYDAGGGYMNIGAYPDYPVKDITYSGTLTDTSPSDIEKELKTKNKKATDFNIKRVDETLDISEAPESVFKKINGEVASDVGEVGVWNGLRITELQDKIDLMEERIIYLEGLLDIKEKEFITTSSTTTPMEVEYL